MFKPLRYTSAAGTGLLNTIDSPEELTTLNMSKPLPNAWSDILFLEFNGVKLGPSAPRPTPVPPCYFYGIGKPI
jgi:hypothetical protein